MYPIKMVIKMFVKAIIYRLIADFISPWASQTRRALLNTKMITVKIVDELNTE